MPKQKRIELRLSGVPGVRIEPPDRSRLSAGEKKYIGYKWDAEEEDFVISSEPELIVCLGQHAAGDMAFLARCIRDGELAPADAETADALGVPYPKSKKKDISSNA